MKNVIIIIFTFLGLILQSQDSSNEAKKLLDEVSYIVKSYDNISIDFKYDLINPDENIKQETRGDVVMQGDKYILNILGVTRIFDGNTMYTISPEDEEVTISNINTNDESTITPSDMLRFYEKGYTYQLDINQNIKGRKIQYVKLIPTNSNAEIEYVMLGIDKNTKHIYNLIEIGSNKSKSVLTVNSFKTNVQVSKTLFTFDENKYSDYYINNLD